MAKSLHSLNMEPNIEDAKMLASFVKSVHKDLREQIKQKNDNDAEEIWDIHIKKTDVLKNYSSSMFNLATEYWHNSDVNCRIFWVEKCLVEYFSDGGFQQKLDKEKRKLTFFEQNQQIDEQLFESEPPMRPKLLDVGSCYNPFKRLAQFDVTAIDLCPADSTVLPCDFLNVNLQTPSQLQSEPCLLQHDIDHSIKRNSTNVVPSVNKAKKQKCQDMNEDNPSYINIENKILLQDTSEKVNDLGLLLSTNCNSTNTVEKCSISKEHVDTLLIDNVMKLVHEDGHLIEKVDKPMEYGRPLIKHQNHFVENIVLIPKNISSVEQGRKTIKSDTDTTTKLDENSTLTENVDNKIENGEPLIENTDHSIENKDHSIENKDHSIENKDHSIENKDHSIENKDHSIENQDRSIENKDHSIENKDYSNQGHSIENNAANPKIDHRPIESDTISIQLGPSEIKMSYTDNSDNKPIPYIKSLPRSYFNIVIFSLFLTYIPSPRLRYRCCQKAYDLLTPNGLLCIVTPDSKHQDGNAHLFKLWKVTLGRIGFQRIKYEKRQHFHGMVFRKGICKEVWVKDSLRELECLKKAGVKKKFQNLDYSKTLDSIYIPQDMEDLYLNGKEVEES